MPSATLTLAYLCGVLSFFIICVRLVLRALVVSTTNIHRHPRTSKLILRTSAFLGPRAGMDPGGMRPYSTNMTSLGMSTTTPTYRQRMFKSDDIVMGLAIIALILRVAMIHLVLICGTNTWIAGEEPDWVQTWKRMRESSNFRIAVGQQLHLAMASPAGIGSEVAQEIDDNGQGDIGDDEAREMIILGSKLVIVGRLAYAGFIWCMKICVLIFYQRIIPTDTSKKYTIWIRIIWASIALTFLGVLIATIAECRPFHLYWQIFPSVDHCAHALVQLWTMGVSNIVTDLTLIVLPLPLIIKSRLPLIRKIHLSILFSIGLFVIAITITRLPLITFPGKGLQDARTTWASIEILAACIVANAPVLYSLIRTLSSSLSARNGNNIAGNPTIQFHDANAVSMADNGLRIDIDSTYGTEVDSVRESRTSIIMSSTNSSVASVITEAGQHHKAKLKREESLEWRGEDGSDARTFSQVEYSDSIHSSVVDQLSVRNSNHSGSQEDLMGENRHRSHDRDGEYGKVPDQLTHCSIGTRPGSFRTIV